MSFYKCIKVIYTSNGETIFRIRYESDIVHVAIVNGEFMVREFGNILTPIYDCSDNQLIGFVEYVNI